MGQFSWKYSDNPTRSIKSGGGKAIMMDNTGVAWIENNYEGYGVFGGKDYYELLAEMNGLESCREAGIDLAFSDKPHIAPRLFSFEFIHDLMEDSIGINYAKLFERHRAPEKCPRQGWVNASGYAYEDEEDYTH